ncbi:MAG TPA: biopolymer transporter ExbD [Burkholderiaceae bacterium]|jgi:biopolymer transport protein ExbD|nr:biopolymer transporter ExbD [Burkholderiaceae bacterium]
MDFRKGRAREELEINLIPFIDVLLVILIFMMVTTTYSKTTALQITLPTEDTEKAVDKPFEITVGIDAQGHYAINNTQISAAEVPALRDELTRVANEKGEGKEPVIIISADALATHQTVMNVLNAASEAGFGKVTFYNQASGKK